jgi:hypothetical protein
MGICGTVRELRAGDLSMQQQTSIPLEGLGTLWNVLTPEKRVQLQNELQATIDKWHRVEMQAIVNAALFAIQQQQAMKAMQNNGTEETTDAQEVKQ